MGFQKMGVFFFFLISSQLQHVEWTVLTGSRPGRTGAPRRGERGDNERILPPKLQYYTDKHHLHHFMKKKKKKTAPPVHYPASPDKPMLSSLPPSPPLPPSSSTS